MVASRRWRDWIPPQEIENRSDSALTKPPKSISVSFVSSNSSHFQIVAASDGFPSHDPGAWREPVADWLHSECVRHRRCFSNVVSLHRAYCEWELSHDDAPCRRETFELLVGELGFLIVDKLVSGLILRADFEGLRGYPEYPGLCQGDLTG
jgi:hypothetical protein